MAQLIERVPEEIIEDLKAEMADYRKPGQWKKDEGGCHPRRRSMNALQRRPHPEAFRRGLAGPKARNLARGGPGGRALARSGAADIQPLLYLMESAEKRNAFKKSLKYLEEAERLDRLNPEVRRARLRLLLAAALRHLRERKAHLALVEIEQIEAVPDVRSGEIANWRGAPLVCSRG